MVNHILKFPRPVVLIITILAGVLPKLCARKNEQDNVEVVTEFPCLLGHPVQ